MVIVKSAVKFEAVTEKLCVADAELKQVVNAVNVPEVVIAANATLTVATTGVLAEVQPVVAFLASA